MSGWLDNRSGAFHNPPMPHGRPRPAARPGRRDLGRDEAARRRSRRVGAVGFLLAAALPVVLWHDLVADIVRAYEPGLTYLVSAWTPWVLMGLGLLCFVRIAIADLRYRDRRFHPPATGAWAGWGVTLYLLGFGLATQVAQIADTFRAG